MKNVMTKVSLYAAAAFALSAVPGFAQQAGHVSVKVPFGFTAGTESMPAGEYDIQEAPNGVVLISSPSAHKSILVLTNSMTAPDWNDHSTVKFDRNGEGYVLSEINVPGVPSRKVIRLEHDNGAAAMSTKLGVTNAASKGLKK